MSSSDIQNDYKQQSPVKVVEDEEVKAASSSPVPSPTHSPTSKEREAADKEPVLVRIARETSLRRLITYVLAKLEAGSTVTIQALTLQVHRAITAASIVRDRLGNVHQVNSLLVVQENSSTRGERDGQRSTSGIQIVLSFNQLSKDDVGYQKPKPKGYAQPILRRSKSQIHLET